MRKISKREQAAKWYLAHKVKYTQKDAALKFGISQPAVAKGVKIINAKKEQQK